MANQPKKYKKFVATAATATLVASAIVPVASAASFKDVSENNEFAPYIDALTEAGIINGYASTNTFQPGAALTRGQVVKMLGRWVESNGVEIPSDWNTKARFTDVPTNHKDQELVKYAALVADEGVFGGAAGKLMAGNNITRQQMAKVLNGAYAAVNGQSLVEIAEGVDNVRIPDLATARAEFEDAIQALMDLEISSTNSGNFRPLENVTRAQFSKFLYNTINFEASDVAPYEIKAVNSTHVEVIFDKDIENIDKVKFEIEGLKVEGAVVKQTSKRTAVLTTSEQKGGTEYTVKVDGEKAGTFIGIAAVIPTAIDVNTTSVQGVIGNEVTLTATVKVPEGQSKEGVSVTFNVTNSDPTKNEKLEVEAFTNAEGVATYKYTRYYASEDNVTAYASKKSSVYSNGKVYWANKIQLSVSEITTGNELANETKKSYKVTGAPNSTYYIAIKENLNVAPDKITDVKVQNHGTQNFVTPYELTTGATSFATVTTNANGEGSFTIYGTNLSATPIVYAPESTPVTPVTYTYNKLDLQAAAPTVKFSQVDRLAISVVGEGTADSAQYYGTVAPVKYDANSAGGRTYTVTVTDKEGKVAPAGTVAYVAFESGNIAGDVYFSTGTSNFVKVKAGDVKAVAVGKDGKAQFRVAGQGATTYVKPTVFLNTAGDVSPAKLDKTDVQAAAEVTYFKTPVVTNAVLKVTDVNGREVTSLTANEDAYFTYQSVDQNGFAYRPGTYTTTPGSTTTIYVQHTDPVTGVVTFVPQVVTNNPITSNTYVLAFDVTSTFGNAVVKNANGTALTAVQNQGSTKTYHVNSNAEGQAVVRVTSQSADTVSVNVTGASNILPTQTASVSFTDSTVLPSIYTGNAYIDTVKDEITFAKAGGGFYQTVSYANSTFTDNGVTIDKAKFEQLIGNNYAEVTVTRDANGNYHFNFRQATSTPKPGTPSANHAPVAVATDKTYTVGAGNQTINISSLATDADSDALSFVGAVQTTNAAVAQAITSGSNLVISVGSTTGTTTLTVNVTDGKETIAVSFDVTVNPVAYFSVTGNPAVSYAAATPAKVTLAAPTVTADGDLTIGDGATSIDVPLLANANVANIVNAINTNAGTLVTATAVNNGADIEIKLNTPGNTTLTVAPAATGGVTGSNLTATNTGTAALKAKYSFKVAGTVPVGKDITVKIGSKTYTHKVTATETTPALIAAGIAATIGTGSTTAGEYNAVYTAGSDTLIIEQAVAAPESGATLTVTNN